jgi:AcrR family transcriptional regulator
MILGMVRWTPGSRERLLTAALDAFAERGFDNVTVAEIAASAGLTERTFFRYFPDKREVLFHGQELLRDMFVEAIRNAPADETVITVIRSALRAVGEEWFPDERRAFSRARAVVIAADPSLQERESLKMRSLSAAIAEALRARGTPDPHATLAAETAVTAFHVSFQQWLRADEARSLADIQDAMLDEIGALTRA